MKPQEILKVIDNLQKGDLIEIHTGEGYQETGCFDRIEDNLLCYLYKTSTNPIDLSVEKQPKKINLGRILKLHILKL